MIAFGGPAGVVGLVAGVAFLAVEEVALLCVVVVDFGVVVVEVCAVTAIDSASINTGNDLCIFVLSGRSRI
jgi:hypothetical protein